MLHRVALVWTNLSEEVGASFISVLSSSETSVLTRATWRNIPEDAILTLYEFVLIRPHKSQLVPHMPQIVTYWISFQPHYGARIYTASNRNEYQEYSRG
jgi:hypothetical protein